MKRSEAVEMIALMLYGHPDDNESDADRILTKLEEAGMLPPSRYNQAVELNQHTWEAE